MSQPNADPHRLVLPENIDELLSTALIPVSEKYGDYVQESYVDGHPNL